MCIEVSLMPLCRGIQSIIKKFMILGRFRHSNLAKKSDFRAKIEMESKEQILKLKNKNLKTKSST